MEFGEPHLQQAIMYVNQIKHSDEIDRKYIVLTRETNKAAITWVEFKQDYARLCNYWNQHYMALTDFVVSRTGNMEIAYNLSGLKASMDNCAGNLQNHEKLVLINLEKIQLYMQSNDPLKFYYAWTAITLTWHHLYATLEICREFENLYIEFQKITESFPCL
ncbi:hypothetical protein AVEN_131479-1 [Araneus ventricosus]|uniref:Uncharacterized protein n=1 Tax=Araneus ventricosus TaxID=182803 RepID=A0A4Y2JCT2_ARAVE|nr:hypothetical protein AVEN_131479-1 [Araneus ventricosus]